MKQLLDVHALKYIVSFLVVLGIRFLPFRPPNVEPVMAVTMPLAQRFGALGGFLFAAFSIVFFDAVTSGLGYWTAVTAVVYGLLGALAHVYLRNKKPSAKNFLGFAVVSTLLYDALTGLTIGPLFWGQPFMEALIGQIPFTLAHLIGNSVLAVIISPLLYRWVVENEKLSFSAITRPAHV